MKVAIRYFTKSKKGNTFKLATVVSEVAGVEALTVENDLTEEVETLFLVNAMYAFNIDKEVKEFLKNNNCELVDMVRFEVGEGLEKRQDNFAEEVMNQING